MISLALPLSLLAKEGSEHVADMHAVFGVSTKQETLNDLFFAITRKIDNRGNDNLNAQLKALSNNKFSESKFGHRIYFHWGFNGKPEDSPALVRQINLATTNDAVRAAMFDLVRKVHRRRREEILLQVQIAANTLHDKSKPLKRREMNVIAALAYDVHVLGDYVVGTDDTIQAIMSLDKIYLDIRRAFYQLVKNDEEFRDHPDRQMALKNFLRKMKRAAKMGSQKDAGEKMLELMKKNVPGLLLMTGRTRRALGLYARQSKN